MKKLLLAIVIINVQFTISKCIAQQNPIDSILLVLKNCQDDTNKVVALNDLGWEYLNIAAPIKADSISQIALKLSQSLNFKRGIARSYKIIGYASEDLGNYDNALKSQFELLRIETEIDERKGIAIAYNNIGNIYTHQGNYSDALKNYLDALKIQLEIGNKRGIANAYLNIGNIFFFQGSYPEGLKNYLLALKLREEYGDEKGVAGVYINIGSIYSKLGNYPEALKNYVSSLEINKKIGNKQDLGLCYSSVGDIYRLQRNYIEASKNAVLSLQIFEEIGDKYNLASSYYLLGSINKNQNKFSEAIVNFKASLTIKEEIGDKEGIAVSLLKLGQIATKLNRLNDAANSLFRALTLSKRIGLKETTKDCYYELTTLDSIKGNWKGAYEYHKLYTAYRDSLNNEENTKKIVQSQMQYEFDKKVSLAKAEQDKKDALALKENEKQKIITYSVSAGLILMLILAIFILKGYRQKQKANLLLADKNKIIEEKNRDITDSINYALRIQNAMLPGKDEILKEFPESFILFKPKAIVSGDFYFFNKVDHCIFLAAVDCTGHGVPGALMSMLGSEKLSEAVSLTNDTSEILGKVNFGIKSSLRQTKSIDSTKDGMDIGLCMIDTSSNIINFAGANRPMWIVRKGINVIEELKSTKRSIGGFTEENQFFESHEVELQKGDTFYLFSDGYPDTFSGADNKKLTIKQFSKLLLDIQSRTMLEQEKYLEDFIENWKAGAEQVDDILVIGVRL